MDNPKIYVWWDSCLDQKYQEALVEAVENVLKIGGIGSPNNIVKVFGNFNAGKGPYKSADWYINSAYDKKRGQVSAPGVLYRCIGEPWQEKEKHWDVVGCSYDLWPGVGDSDSFVYGLTTPDVGTIVSPDRMLEHGENAEALFYLLAAHELAHLFGAPDETRKGLQNLGEWHCPRVDCALGQVDMGDRPDLLTAARRIANSNRPNGSSFCEDCYADIRKGVRRFAGLPDLVTVLGD